MAPVIDHCYENGGFIMLRLSRLRPWQRAGLTPPELPKKWLGISVVVLSAALAAPAVAQDQTQPPDQGEPPPRLTRDLEKTLREVQAPIGVVLRDLEKTLKQLQVPVPGAPDAVRDLEKTLRQLLRPIGVPPDSERPNPLFRDLEKTLQRLLTPNPTPPNLPGEEEPPPPEGTEPPQ